MQDMGSWNLLGDHLQTRDPDLSVAAELGRVLGKLHHHTSNANASPEYWTELGKFR